MNAENIALQYQRCGTCKHHWYFTRSFCPACGSDAVTEHASTGTGTLYASTLVHRAPAEAFRSLLPYSIVLVDMHDGFRVMGHSDRGLPIGSPVVCELREIAGRQLPYFAARQTIAVHDGAGIPPNPDPTIRRH